MTSSSPTIRMGFSVISLRSPYAIRMRRATTSWRCSIPQRKGTRCPTKPGPFRSRSPKISPNLCACPGSPHCQRVSRGLFGEIDEDAGRSTCSYRVTSSESSFDERPRSGRHVRDRAPSGDWRGPSCKDPIGSIDVRLWAQPRYGRIRHCARRSCDRPQPPSVVTSLFDGAWSATKVRGPEHLRSGSPGARMSR